MSKKLNIFPGIGFFLMNSAAAKENLCPVIPTPYSSWEKENDSVTVKKKGKKEQAGKPVMEEPPRSRLSLGQVAMTGLVIVALSVFGTVTLSFSFSQLEYGVWITGHKFSFAAAEFMRKNPIPGKMFNFFDIGGFLH